MLETLDYTIRIGSTPTILYFDLYLYSALNRQSRRSTLRLYIYINTLFWLSFSFSGRQNHKQLLKFLPLSEVALSLFLSYTGKTQMDLYQ